MDKWKYYDITHRDHRYFNPMFAERFDTLIGMLDLQSGATVLDIACGSGEFLIDLIETYSVSGVGVDLSPPFIKRATKNVAERLPDADIALYEMDGADYRPEGPQPFALTACIGASWIFGGHRGTLDALMRMTEPGGWVIVGEPYWRQEPNEEYLTMAGMTKAEFGTHWENVSVGEAMGLNLVYSFVSTQAEWDMYEGLQWRAADAYARSHPEDEDVSTLLDRIQKEKEIYLRWGRETLGWTIYLFRRK